MNQQGFIDTTEAFQFERQLMGTFSSITDGIDQSQLDQVSNNIATDDLLNGLKLWALKILDRLQILNEIPSMTSSLIASQMQLLSIKWFAVI